MPLTPSVALKMSAMLLLIAASSACTSAPSAQQCPQPRPIPAELRAEPQSLIPLIDQLFPLSGAEQQSN